MVSINPVAEKEYPKLIREASSRMFELVVKSWPSLVTSTPSTSITLDNGQGKQIDFLDELE